MATEAERQYIIQEAQRRAQAAGTTPEMEVWKYAQSVGMSPEAVDSYFGWTPGTTTQWAVSNGQMAAPQGNFNPQTATVAAPASATITSTQQGIQPLSPQERQRVIADAQQVAQQQGITPEKALWDWSVKNNIAPDAIDAYMGFAPGTSAQWATENKQVQALPQSERDRIVAEAQRVAASSNISPERALWDWAKANNIAPNDIDTYMGWQQGTAQGWYDGQQRLNETRQQATPATSTSPFQQSSIVGGLFSDTFKKAGVTPSATDAAAAWNTVSPFGLVGQMNQDWAKDVKINMGNATQVTPATVTPTTNTTGTATDTTRGGNSGGTAGREIGLNYEGMRDYGALISQVSPELGGWITSFANQRIAEGLPTNVSTNTVTSPAGNVPANPVAADPATIAAAERGLFGTVGPGGNGYGGRGNYGYGGTGSTGDRD